MKLTPITVPGKRRRAGEPANSRGVSKRKRTRKTLTKAPSKDSKKLRHGKVSYLEEHLPLEILRSIFMYSENINLVRASPLLGKFLSEIETRREVFVHAFAPTWCEQSKTGLSKLDRKANPDFQSALLEFFWVNMRFITQCFEQCARIFPQSMEGRDIFGDLNMTFDDEDAKVTVEDAAGEMNATERCFMVQFATFVSKKRAVDKWVSLRVVIDSISMVHYKARIPDDLITGPWDDEALKKFFWLTRVGACFQEDQTWELAYTGLETALKQRHEPNGRAISALMLLERTIAELKWPTDKLTEAHKLIYPLECKAAWTEKHSVHAVLSSFRRRLEDEATNAAQRVHSVQDGPDA